MVFLRFISGLIDICLVGLFCKNEFYRFIYIQSSSQV